MAGAVSVRVLRPGDESALAPFFAAHPDTTLFLQSNLLAAGLEDRGEPLQGTYVAACGDDGAIRAVACHTWSGNLLLEAPTALAEVARAAVAATKRPIAGVLGRAGQVDAACRALGLTSRPTSLDSREELFRLSLAQLRIPALLAGGPATCRAPREAERELLVAWRHDYAVEALGETPGDALRAKCGAEMSLYQGLGRHFVLECEGRPVAYAAYNAETRDCVQIGGVWTPPSLRARGFGRAVVAGALLRARERGLSRSVLFTPVDNAPAQAAYRALGYERVGDYALRLFANPVGFPSP